VQGGHREAQFEEIFVSSSAPRFVYAQGAHVCTLYLTPDYQLDAAIEYIKGGLQRGERCVYICCEHPIEVFRDALRWSGIDVAAEEDRGALVLIRKEEAYLRDGAFDPSKMIELLRDAVADALDDGFKGLCAAGDMIWIRDQAPGTEGFAHYESRLNQFFEASHALGLCQYNLHSLPPEVVDRCLATHPYVRLASGVVLDNPFYDLSDDATERIASPALVKEKLDRLDELAKVT
jgi:hypothetical protein